MEKARKGKGRNKREEQSQPTEKAGQLGTHRRRKNNRWKPVRRGGLGKMEKSKQTDMMQQQAIPISSRRNSCGAK